MGWQYHNEFDSWLWSLSDSDLAALSLRDVASAAARDGVEVPQLTFLVGISDDEDPFSRLRLAAGDAIAEARDLDRVGLILARSGREAYVVSFWSTEREGVYQLMSAVPVTDPKWRRVEDKWVRGARALGPVLLDKGDFESIGDSLSEHGRVEVSRLAARVSKDRSSYTRGWQSSPDRVRPSHRDALEETEGMVVRTMTLSMPTLIVHLRRVAGATFYRGDYRLFVDRVLARLTSAAGNRQELLRGRGRVPLAPVTEKLSIQLAEPVLDGTEGREALLESLRELSAVQTAVFHANPYLHLCATDFSDGSSFDILVTEGDRIEMIPGPRASVASASRIMEALGDSLGLVSVEESDVPAVIADNELIGS